MLMGRRVLDVKRRSISSALACSQYCAWGLECDFLQSMFVPSSFKFSGQLGNTMMAKGAKEEVGGEVSGAQVGSRARDERFNVSVAFVDR
jgi:hypothetical protein